MVLYIRMSRKEAIEDTVDDLHAEDEDNIEEEESEVTLMEIAPVPKRLPEHTKRRPFQYQGFFISVFTGRRP